MDLNRIIQALKGTIDPKLRIAAENELNQVRRGPSAPLFRLSGAPAGWPGSLSPASLVLTPTRLGLTPHGGSRPPPPLTPPVQWSRAPRIFAEQLAHLLATFAPFRVVFLLQCSLFSPLGPQEAVFATCVSVFRM